LNDADEIPDEDMEQLKFTIWHQTCVKKGSMPIYYIHCEKYQTVNHQTQGRSETVPSYIKVSLSGYEVQVKLATHNIRDILLQTAP
jgi:hypothetical protein